MIFYASPEDIKAVAPKGYKMAVLRLPFMRKFAIVWWVKDD